MTAPFTSVSNTATISTTEYSVPAATTVGTPTSQTTAAKKLTISVDVSAIIAGDDFDLTIYEKVNGGTQRVLDKFSFVGVSGPNVQLGPYDLSEGWDVTWKKNAGTDRSIRTTLKYDVGDANIVSVTGGYLVPSIWASGQSSDDESEVWPREFKVSEATPGRRTVFFYMLSQASSGLTASQFQRNAVASTTYATVALFMAGFGTATVSKNGAAGVACAGTFAEVNTTQARGLFSYEFTATELDTPGYVLLTVGGVAGNPKPRVIALGVVPVDKYDGVRMGLTALPNAAFSTAGGLQSTIIRTGTAQAGAAGTITLDAGASATTNQYVGKQIRTTGGTGPGQARRCTAYNGTTKVATVKPNWNTNPGVTTTFEIDDDSGYLEDAAITSASFASGAIANAAIAANAIAATNIATGAITNAKFAAGAIDAAAIANAAIDYATFAADALDMFRIRRRATAQAGAAGTITLDAGATATDNIYNGSLVYIYGGTGIGQTRLIRTYVGATKVATVYPNWQVNPDATSTFIVFGNSAQLEDNAITANSIDTTGVTDIQTGLATSAAQTAAQTDLTTLTGRLTALRAGYLDNLNVGGNVASSAEVVAVQNNTKVVRVVPDLIERPDSGTMVYRIEILLYDQVGNMETPDSAPTLDLVDQSGTSLNARLGSTTMTLVTTGRYRTTYTASSADNLDQLIWVFTVVESGLTRVYGNTSLIVDTTAVDFTAADRTKLNRLDTDYTTALAGKIDTIDTKVARIDTDYTTIRADKIDNLDAAVTTRSTPATGAAAVVASIIEGSETLGDTLRLLTAVLMGKANIDNGAGTFTFFAKDGVTARVVGTIVGTLRALTTRNGA